MKWGSIVGEAVRNVRSGTARTAWIAVGTAIILLLLVVAESSVVSGLLGSAERFRNSGAATFVIVAAGQVDGEKCDLLAETPNAISSGAVRAAKDLTVNVLPSQPIHLFEATRGFARTLPITQAGKPSLPRGPFVALESSLSATLGATPGTQIATDQGPLTVSGSFTFPADGRTPRLENSAVVITNPLGPFDECWVSYWPVPDTARTLLLTALVPTTETIETSTFQLNPTLGASFDGPTKFADRVTRFAPLVAFVACLLTSLVATRRRGLEFALGRHLGIRRSEQVVMVAIESLFWLIPVAAIGAAGSLAIGSALPPETQLSITPLQLAIVIAATAGALAGTLSSVAFLRNSALLKLIRER